MYLKESCFPDCWKVSLVIPVFKNAGGKQTTENLDVINKAFKKVVIGLFIAKCSIFSDFQYGFRSSQSTTDLLIFVSNGIARVFNRSGAS